jgi:hypothetical protein
VPASLHRPARAQRPPSGPCGPVPSDGDSRLPSRIIYHNGVEGRRCRRACSGRRARNCRHVSADALDAVGRRSAGWRGCRARCRLAAAPLARVSLRTGSGSRGMQDEGLPAGWAGRAAANPTCFRSARPQTASACARECGRAQSPAAAGSSRLADSPQARLLHMRQPANVIECKVFFRSDGKQNRKTAESGLDCRLGHACLRLPTIDSRRGRGCREAGQGVPSAEASAAGKRGSRSLTRRFLGRARAIAAERGDAGGRALRRRGGGRRLPSGEPA